MQINSYDHERDFNRVGRFLIETYRPGDTFTNWLQPRWEYMHFLPSIKQLDLSKIGIFEQNDQIIGVVHFESQPFQAYFQIRPGFEKIKPQMFDYAEQHFEGVSQSTGRMIRALYLNDFDQESIEIAMARGYHPWAHFSEQHSIYRLEGVVPESPLPEGYHIQSLADGLDLRKVNRVLWRGFDHPGPPPDEEIEGRRKGMRAPNFRRDLTIVVVTPDGNYASYCGMWIVPDNRVAYVEPVATDPDFRRRGMGKAAVLESLRRVARLGAEVAWVGSGLKFYESIGFKRMFATLPWVKYLD